MAETKAESGNILGTEKLGTLLRKFAVPNVIALLVAALYNIVDQLFIANASYLGSYGNAANTVVYPMTVIALALAVMVGDGTCTFMSLSLGKGNREDANKSVGNAIVAVLVISVILTALYFIFMNPLLNAFGGRVNAQTFEQSKIYFTWIAMGIPGYMFGQAMNSIIRGDGSPKFAMAATLAGAVVNIIFDPIFIFGMKWGMMGAAIATIMGQYLTAALSIWYLFHLKTVTLKASGFRPDQRILKNCTINGITSFLAQISLVAAMLAMQNMVVKYGGMDPVFGQEQYAQIPMAVIGIVMKFFQIIISIVVGMAAGCIPIVGFNMGAGKKRRVRSLFTRLLLYEALVGAIGLVIVEFFPRQLIAIFGAANESSYYTDFAIKSFRTYLCMLVFACVNKSCFIFLQAMGKAVQSTILSMVREIVFGVGFALLLPRFFGLDGVLYSMPVSDVLTFVIALVLILQTYRELREDAPSVKKPAKGEST